MLDSDLQPEKRQIAAATRSVSRYGPAVALPDPQGVSGAGVPFEGAEPFSELSDWLRIIRKRKATILLVAFAGALVGLFTLLPRTPVYRASVSIEIQPQNDDFFYAKDVNPSSAMGGNYPEIDQATQVKVLQTRALQSRVVAKLDADESLRLTPPEDRTAAWRKALHLPLQPVPSRQDLLLTAAGSVSVKPSRTSRVIDISCDSTDPKLAAAFANAMASEYQDQTLEKRWQSAQHTGEWLSRQLDDMKINLQKSEEDLQTYAAAMNLVLTGDKDKANVADDKLRQLQAQVSEAQADLAAKQAKYELTVTNKPDSLGQVLDDTTLRSFDSKLADLRRQLAELSSTLTPAHYKVQTVQAQINEMETDRRNARDRVVERIRTDYEEASRREKLLSTAFSGQASVVSDQAGKIIHYNILQREVDSNRQLYESLLQRVKEAGISSALKASNIQIIDAAEVPSAPFSPNLPTGVLTGLLTGLCAGFGLVLFQEKANRNIELPGDAAFFLNAPELGAIPSASLDRPSGAPKSKALRLADFGAGTTALISTSHPGGRSLVAEAFRVILTSLLFIGKRRPTQVMVVTSPGVSEGKTRVLSNLAVAYAETGRSVLVIDGDMRRPRLHEIFGISNESGLAGLLAQTESLDARSIFTATQRFQTSGVSVLPSGKPEVATSNLLHSKRLPELIALAREQFDIVLIDTPPMLHIADSRVVGSLADGVILVIRSRQTSRDAAITARRQLAEDGVPVIGIALNDWNPKVAGYYSTYDYAKYYEGRS